MVRKIATLSESHGYPILNQHHSIFAYADDIAIVSDNPGRLQLLLFEIGKEATALGLKFNPAKCATFHMGDVDNKVFNTSFSIQGGHPPALKENEVYKYLGRPTGYKPFIDVSSSLAEMEEDLNNIENSPLAPWQKVEAVNVFLLSRLNYLLRSGYIQKGQLKEMDIKIRNFAKRCTSLPPTKASPEPLYISYKEGGLNLLPLRSLADISTIVQTHQFLSSRDPFIQDLSLSSLSELVARRARRPTTMTENALFLEGSMEGDLGLPSNESTSFWARARIATRELKKKVPSLAWKCVNEVPVLHIHDSPLLTTFAEKRLKAAVRGFFLTKLQNKRSQGLSRDVLPSIRYLITLSTKGSLFHLQTGTLFIRPD